jgi:hypothetical protein
MPDDLQASSTMNAQPSRAHARTATQVVLFVFLLAALVRLVAMGSLPLLITEDGVDYLRLGEAIAAVLSRTDGASWPAIPAVRTPGYPVFLGLIIAFFGKSPVPIMLLQHLMGIGIATLVAWASIRLAGPKVGPWLATLVGSLVALDPWLLACESFLLTESASAFFVTLPAACILAWRRPSFLRGLFIGACIACAIHIRPACQILVPFFVAGAMLAGFEGWRRLPRWREALVPALLCGSGAALALTAILGPWLVHNFNRGVKGMAQGFDTQLWIYFWKEGIVDDHDMPPEFRDAFLKSGLDKILTHEKRAYEFLPFINDLKAWEDVAVGKKLSDWAKASAARHPDKYSKRFQTALLTQLNFHTDASNVLWEELPGFVGALGRGWSADAPPDRRALPKNFLVYNDRDNLKPYRMETDGGLPGRALRWYAAHHPKGFPYLGLFALALLVCLVAFIRGRWTLVLVFAALLASILVYALLLAIFARYGVPYWMPLYLAPAALVASFRRRDAHPNTPEPSPDLAT